jgi:hypothetical protein
LSPERAPDRLLRHSRIVVFSRPRVLRPFRAWLYSPPETQGCAKRAPPWANISRPFRPKNARLRSALSPDAPPDGRLFRHLFPARNPKKPRRFSADTLYLSHGTMVHRWRQNTLRLYWVAVNRCVATKNGRGKRGKSRLSPIGFNRSER